MPTDLGNAPYGKKQKTVNAEKQSPKRQGRCQLWDVPHQCGRGPIGIGGGKEVILFMILVGC